MAELSSSEHRRLPRFKCTWSMRSAQSPLFFCIPSLVWCLGQVRKSTSGGKSAAVACREDRALHHPCAGAVPSLFEARSEPDKSRFAYPNHHDESYLDTHNHMFIGVYVCTYRDLINMCMCIIVCVYVHILYICIDEHMYTCIYMYM